MRADRLDTIHLESKKQVTDVLLLREKETRGCTVTLHAQEIVQ